MGDIGSLSDVTGDLTVFSDAVPNGTVYFRQFGDGGTVIPEPTTLVLFGAGAAPLALRLLRRRKKN